MKRYVECQDRSQVTLFPESLDEYIAEDNPVRVVAPKGMGRFNDVLTPADADAIHTYITEQAWAAKTAGSAH